MQMIGQRDIDCVNIVRREQTVVAFINLDIRHKRPKGSGLGRVGGGQRTEGGPFGCVDGRPHVVQSEIRRAQNTPA